MPHEHSSVQSQQTASKAIANNVSSNGISLAAVTPFPLQQMQEKTLQEARHGKVITQFKLPPGEPNNATYSPQESAKNTKYEKGDKRPSWGAPVLAKFKAIQKDAGLLKEVKINDETVTYARSSKGGEWVPTSALQIDHAVSWETVVDLLYARAKEIKSNNKADFEQGMYKKASSGKNFYPTVYAARRYYNDLDNMQYLIGGENASKSDDLPVFDTVNPYFESNLVKADTNGPQAYEDHKWYYKEGNNTTAPGIFKGDAPDTVYGLGEAIRAYAQSVQAPLIQQEAGVTEDYLTVMSGLKNFWQTINSGEKELSEGRKLWIKTSLLKLKDLIIEINNKPLNPEAVTPVKKKPEEKKTDKSKS